MNAVLQETHSAHVLLNMIRDQINVLVDHGMKPSYVVMNVNDYNELENIADNKTVCYNDDHDSVNGLPIVVCAVSKPVVTSSPSELRRVGLI